MKHTREKLFTYFLLLILALTTLFSAVFSVAFADMPSTKSNTQKTSDYKVVNVLDANKEIVGAQIGGAYFADIPVNVQIYDKGANKEDAKILDFAKVFDEFVTHIDNLVSTSIETSEIAQFNKLAGGQSMEISEETAKMIETSREIYNFTDGAYDPTCYRLVDLWGFSSRTYYQYTNYLYPYDREWTAVGNDGYDYYPLPEQKFVDAFVELADLSKIELSEENGKYILTKTMSDVVVDGVKYSQWLDLGGVAKGYVADVLKTMLDEWRFTKYKINVGGSSQYYGINYDDEAFNIGLHNPYVYGTPFVRYDTSDVFLSTSGTYERYYPIGGKRYCHIISPKTGRPIETNVDSVTVQSPTLSAAALDCLTTAVAVMGKDNSIALMNKDYTKDNNLDIVVAYSGNGMSAEHQLITNKEKDFFTDIAPSFSYAVKIDDNGKVIYNNPTNIKKVIIIVSSVVAVALLALIVYKVIVNRENKITEKVINVKQDKFFKKWDIAVYVVVAVVIVVLLINFLTRNASTIETVKIETLNGGELFRMNTLSGKFDCYNVDGYVVTAENVGKSVVVTVVAPNGENYNQVTVNLDGTVSVKMTDALCGDHEQCVRYFPEVKESGRSIVCMPNAVKVVTADEINYILV